ncbi:hypothetical protein Kpol_1004p44 [Vanderwaltozyma polyspora DSM 70294]|uniref:Histone-lysine N-methyltransferase, H3 lysine-79 specific n=1 Tax=Vanderwaltozyma polyspora (strain ATCC 22028 / DSM 70294 / BCRC 21397 / CBS 2163 / NBRC 10782 / NRRL Y-8283 / UCD 57-17) TaxID=436907 RepID=A7TJA0_VANPO|nr:uncharacterized protein Kpol_1004p44 [Vanderwaltozyma polyspora DSM 70294]EDO17669.1 hypothetical protein Kpol_1004p44 [Vanderwaltozyma polyspora DSM 70294]
MDSSVFSNNSGSVSVETSVEISDSRVEGIHKVSKGSSGVQSLLEDAYRYSAHSDYTLPGGFLRQRKPPKRFVDSSDDEGDGPTDKKVVKINQKKSMLSNGVKSKSILNSGKSIDGLKKKPNGKDKKNGKVTSIEKTVKSNSKSKSESKLKTNLKTKLKTKAELKSKSKSKSTADSKPVSKLESNATSSKAKYTKKNKKSPEPALLNNSVNGDSPNDSENTNNDNENKVINDVPVTPSSFADLTSPFFEFKYKFFDIDYLKSNDRFKGNITQSISITEKYYKSKGDNIIPKFVKLKYPLFLNYEEEYHIDFSNESFSTIYNPMSEIGKIIEYCTEIYIPDQFLKQLETEVIKPLNETFDNSDELGFINTVNRYNDIIEKIPRDLMIEKLNNTKSIPKNFIHDFLHIIYTRTIHPKANKLRQYAAFSSFVYGELLPSFLSEVYSECSLKEGDVFMDLGSGVGNCVVQAALEYGCGLSFGCEIMENASDLTEAQFAELQQRARLFGIRLSPVEYSLRESFVDNKRVDELIKKCDVLLVNNFLFDSKLNLEVEKIIQNCKSGCKIISLKSLRPLTYTIDFDDIENILNRLSVKKHKLKENSVSWTHRGGEFYISTVLSDVDDSLFTSNAGHRRNERLKYTR